MKKLIVTLTTLLAIMLLAVACGGSSDGTPDIAGTTTPPGGTAGVPAGGLLAQFDTAVDRFARYVNIDAPHVPGTTFMYGLILPTPWTGIFGASSAFGTGAQDAEIAALMGTGSSLLSMTTEGTIGQEGLATFEYDIDAATITLTMVHQAHWHDGVPVTMNDLVFTYYVIAHPDYDGVRFSAYERMVLGIMDYHNGDADHISGLVLSDDGQQLTIHFESLSPGKMFFGFTTGPMPRHAFEGIAVADMSSSVPVMQQPLGWGPFVFESMVPGESVHLVRNENYVWGTPYIESLVVERIPPELAGTAMVSGRFDLLGGFPGTQFEDHQNPTNFRYLSTPDWGYQYIAFRLGHFNFETGENVFDAHRDMNNVYLRRAMAHAVDQSELGRYLHSGLRTAAGAFLSPNHRALIDTSLPGFPHNPDLANQILDDAGFALGDDGFRNWPDGSPMTVIWAFATDPDTEDVITQFHIQAWARIGVRVELWRGRTHDQFYLWDVLDADYDNEEIHIYTARWTSLADPNPTGIWGHAFWNPSRYTSPQWESILAGLSSPGTWDPAVRRAAYSAMQAHLQEVVPFFPTQWVVNLTALNNRVTRWDTRTGISPQEFGWHVIRLSEAEPVR